MSEKMHKLLPLFFFLQKNLLIKLLLSHTDAIRKTVSLKSVFFTILPPHNPKRLSWYVAYKLITQISNIFKNGSVIKYTSWCFPQQVPQQCRHRSDPIVKLHGCRRSETISPLRLWAGIVLYFLTNSKSKYIFCWNPVDPASLYSCLISEIFAFLQKGYFDNWLYVFQTEICTKVINIPLHKL